MPEIVPELLGPPSGHSDKRTEPKHLYLGAFLGREIGSAVHAARKLRRPYRRHLLYDLTAGDGRSYHEGEWWQTCSPGLFAYHALYRGPGSRPMIVTLADRAAATVADLLLALDKNLPMLGYVQDSATSWSAHNRRVRLNVVCADSRDLDFAEVGAGDMAFVSNDPNSAHDWALNGMALAAAVDRGAVVRSFSALGYNASGIKRLGFKDREKWFDHVRNLRGSLRFSQDLIFMAVDGDDAQWAYAIVTPEVWTARDVAEAERIFGRFGLSLMSSSLRQDRRGFDELLDRLVRTKKERGEP